MLDSTINYYETYHILIFTENLFIFKIYLFVNIYAVP